MKLASREFGEFNALSAQEKDCLERLEKKLNRSVNTAADAEEISEELVDIENFLRHHPEHRLPRIKELAQSLTDKNILPPLVIQDADKLDARWRDLSAKARLRTTILEGILLEQIPIYMRSFRMVGHFVCVVGHFVQFLNGSDHLKTTRKLA